MKLTIDDVLLSADGGWVDASPWEFQGQPLYEKHLVPLGEGFRDQVEYRPIPAMWDKVRRQGRDRLKKTYQARVKAAEHAASQGWPWKIPPELLKFTIPNRKPGGSCIVCGCDKTASWRLCARFCSERCLGEHTRRINRESKRRQRNSPWYRPEHVTPMEKHCDHCSKPFTPKRKDGKFCSNTCRVAHHRAAKRA